jgi:23S rRNA (adenine-N6)-dimethyltransferase
VRASGARRWGWHRLTDHWAARIVADAHIRRGDLVLDIGAGTGALTAELVAAGARVIAVELHPRRAALLQQRFAGARVKVVRADAADLRLPTRPFRVVANPPFAATMAVVRRLVAPGSRLVRADLVLPPHYAHRWADGRAPGAGRWQRTFDARLGEPVPRSAFLPAPPSGAATLVICRRNL